MMGVSATHLDWSAVPYIRETFYKKYIEYLDFQSGTEHPMLSHEERQKISVDDRSFYTDDRCYVAATNATREEIAQSVEALMHNLNTLQSRSGSQLPFTSINYGTCTLTEGRWLIEAILRETIKGIGANGDTYIFPCQIWKYKKGVSDNDPQSPNYDLFQLATLSTSKRMYPNYANCNWSVQKAGEKFDKDTKKQILSELSEKDYQKLITALKEQPELEDILDLTVDGDRCNVRLGVAPEAEMATMGKRKLQPI